MTDQSPLNHTPTGSIILMLIIVCGCSLLSIFISVGAVQLFGGPATDATNITNLNHLRILQMIQSIGTFVIPSIIGIRLFYNNSYKACFGKEQPTAQLIIFSAVIIVVSAPLINWAVFVNQQLPFPPSLEYIKQWMTDRENEALMMTKNFLSAQSVFDIMMNIGLMALLPAIGEEWLFRGMIQPLTARITKNMGVAIVITAILFSAVHFQFLTFFPRVILGIVLGYLYYYGESLWLPIAAHFVNNLIALFTYISYYNSAETTDPLGAVAKAPPILLSISSFILVVLCLYAIKRIKTNPERSTFQ